MKKQVINYMVRKIGFEFNPKSEIRNPKFFRLITFILFASIFFVSCEKDFVVKEQEQAARMTINCEFDNYSVFSVYVTQSSSLSGLATIIPITNARVELYENDSVLFVLPWVPTDSANTFGSYQSTFIPVSGRSYTVKVTHSVYGVATAKDFLPSTPEVSTYLIDHYGNSQEHNKVFFRLQFHDNPSTVDYYRVNVYTVGTHWVYNSPTDSTIEDFGTWVRPEFISEVTDTIRDNGFFPLFSDKSFNGTDKELKILFAGLDTSKTLTAKVVVRFEHVTPAHYLYYQTLERYHQSGQNDEPVHVFGNIDNGYGIFSGAAIYSQFLDVK